MNYCSLNHITKRVCLWLLILFPMYVVALEVPSTKSLAHGDQAFLLTDGVVVGPEKNLVYLLERDGLYARSLASGEIVWQRGVFWKPLGFHGDHLVAFAVDSASRGAQVMFVDSSNGQSVEQIELEFPAPARPLLSDQPNQQFNAALQRDDSDVLIVWDYASRELRGMPMNTTGSVGMIMAGSGHSPQTNSASRIHIDGVFRVVIAARAATLQEDLEASTLAPGFDPLIDTGAPQSLASAQRTFQSHDVEHRLVSKRVSTEKWNRYRWTLTDAASGSVLGQLTLPLAYAPFSVAGNKLIHIAPPTLLRDDNSGEFITHGLRFMVTDIVTGELLWSTEPADPVYRGILPP